VELSIPLSGIAFKESVCVDWLQTDTKQTTGCLQWDCKVSFTLILSYTFSLWSACAQARSALHAAAIGRTVLAMPCVWFVCSSFSERQNSDCGGSDIWASGHLSGRSAFL